MSVWDILSHGNVKPFKIHLEIKPEIKNFHDDHFFSANIVRAKIMAGLEFMAF